VQVDFYHLTRVPIDRVLPLIAQRVLAGGERLLIVSQDDALADRIDKALWTYNSDAFLPHARAGAEADADQPVLIAGDVTPVNGAKHIAFIDGQWRDGALGFDRAFHFFDDENIVAARAAWRGLSGKDGVEPRYWRQDDAGKWERVA
jgi:DNA polymerase III subunit chi